MRSTPQRSPKLKATSAVKVSNSAVKASNSVVRVHPTLCAAKAVKATALAVNPSANRSAVATTASREIPAKPAIPSRVAGKVDKADANPGAA